MKLHIKKDEVAKYIYKRFFLFHIIKTDLNIFIAMKKRQGFNIITDCCSVIKMRF